MVMFQILQTASLLEPFLYHAVFFICLCLLLVVFFFYEFALCFVFVGH